MTPTPPRPPRARGGLPPRVVAVLAAAASVPAVSYLAYGWLQRSDAFAVREVALHGAGSGTAAQVRAAVAEATRGRSLLALSPEGLVRRLEAIPAVRLAAVDRDFPSTLRVRVIQEEPFAYGAAGTTWAVLTRSGRVLAHQPRTAHRPFLPRVALDPRELPDPGERVEERHARTALEVLRAVPERFPGRVLRATADDPANLTAVLESGVPIRLGMARDLPRKLRVAGLVLARFPRAERVTLRYVDVSAPARPVVCRHGGDQRTADAAAPADAATATLASPLVAGARGCLVPPPADPAAATTGDAAVGDGTVETPAVTDPAAGATTTTTATTSIAP